jgi:protein-L-isoaspartate(D-aspartate) O-methyltransferase
VRSEHSSQSRKLSAEKPMAERLRVRFPDLRQVAATGLSLLCITACEPGAVVLPVPTPPGPHGEAGAGQVQATATTAMTPPSPILTLEPTTVTQVTATLTSPAQPIFTSTPTVQPMLTPTASPDPRLQERLSMVETQMQARDITDPDVLKAMEAVPRHEFVLEEFLNQAYEDHPLPIGYGQTISQPYIVALMTQLMNLKRGDKVLEIGTGSGYQAAILAMLTDQVYSVEIIPELAQSAAERLKRLGYTNVHVKEGDGYYGWEEYAPYDAIVVTAAPDHVPQPLVQQLKDGGRLVIPVGPPGGYQSLWQITRKGDRVESKNITGVLFVPLTGGHKTINREGPEVP